MAQASQPPGKWDSGGISPVLVTRGILERELDRMPLWLPVALGGGIGIYFLLPREPALWIGPAAFVVTAMLAWVLRRAPWPRVLSWLCLAIALGFTVAQVRTTVVAAPVLQTPLNGRTVTGEVLDIEAKGSGRRIILHRLAEWPGGSPPALARIKLAGRSPPLRPGDRIRLRAKLSPPPAPAAPGAFDFARQAYFQRVGAVGFSLGAPQRLEASPSTEDNGPLTLWRLFWSAVRQDIAARIEAALPAPRSAIATALMTGQRGEIPEPLLEDLRQAGLAHLLAISGLHMGLVAGLIFFSVRALLALIPSLALTFPIKKWAAVAAALGAFGYLFVAGASIPSQRAFIMVSIVLLAILIDRRAISLRLVAWAATVVLLIAPESLLSVSFQMSFAAVVALVAAYEAIGQEARLQVSRRQLHMRLLLYFGGVCLTSLIASLATAPFAAYHFNRVALFGLAANFLAVPLTAFWIMPWALLAFLLMPIGLEAWALAPMGWGIDGVLSIAARVAGLPGAAPLVPAMPLAALLSMVAGGLWLCLWRSRWRLAGVAPLAFGLMLAGFAKAPDLLVSGNGRLMAVVAPDGVLWLSDRRRERFAASVWKRRGGHSNDAAWPRGGSALSGQLSCDSLGCIYRVKGQVVALARDARAWSDDCAVATLVVSTEPLRGYPCPNPDIVIDRFDLWREGAHAIWIGEEGITVRTVAAKRGQRPWVQALPARRITANVGVTEARSQ